MTHTAPLVIDASVALAWCFEDESTPALDALLERVATEGARVPALWCHGVANGLETARRRGRATEAQVERLAALLTGLPLQVEPVDPAVVLGTVRRLAAAHGLSVYDATYLALALPEGLALAALGRELAEAAAVAGLEVLPGCA